MTEVETPHGVVFSAAAKAYMCASRLLPPTDTHFGYATPEGPAVDCRALAKGIALLTLNDLQDDDFITVRSGRVKVALLQTVQTLLVTAHYAGAAGFSGSFVQATHCAETDLITIMRRLLPRTGEPLKDMLDAVPVEFQHAGVLTCGIPAGQGPWWDAEWRDYLIEAWSPEVLDGWQRAWSRTDRPVVERSVMAAVTSPMRIDADEFEDRRDGSSSLV